ncbi:MAG: imelysin family protein [Flavobacteriales bacterium]|nr:imelysin family protein [Flavobacteriales bacterium]
MKNIVLVLISFLFLFSCSSSDDSSDSTQSADRSKILANWSDNIIIPAYTNFSESTSDLKSKMETFNANPTEGNLVTLRASWKQAYISFQKVEMFNVGKAMSIKYANYLNIYPTDNVQIDSNIQSGSYTLTISSSYDVQGFPALDYLINGLANTDTEIVAFYSTNTKKENYKKYLSDLVNRINDLTTQVLDDWNGGYRDSFVQNSGSSATASFDKLTNSYISYFENALRRGKVGLPAGKFTTSKDETLVEGFYHKEISKELLKVALQASMDFFKGKHFSSLQKGESFSSYLDELNAKVGDENLSDGIENQFDLAMQKVDNLDNNLANEVVNDNNKMLVTYDELQKAVILLKTSMTSALDVKIDYMDNDGD